MDHLLPPPPHHHHQCVMFNTGLSLTLCFHPLGVCYLIGAVCVGDSRKRLQGRSDWVGQDEGTRGRTVLLCLTEERQKTVDPAAV